MARSVIIKNKESNEIQFPETLSLLVRDVSTGNTVAEDIQTIQSSIATKENTSNKVTSISASSTDSQYPSAKCVYDAIQDLDSDYSFEVGPDIYDDVSIVNNNYYFVEGSQQYNDF